MSEAAAGRQPWRAAESAGVTRKPLLRQTPDSLSLSWSTAEPTPVPRVTPGGRSSQGGSRVGPTSSPFLAPSPHCCPRPFPASSPPHTAECDPLILPLKNLKSRDAQRLVPSHTARQGHGQAPDLLFLSHRPHDTTPNACTFGCSQVLSLPHLPVPVSDTSHVTRVRELPAGHAGMPWAPARRALNSPRWAPGRAKRLQTCLQGVAWGATPSHNEPSTRFGVTAAKGPFHDAYFASSAEQSAAASQEEGGRQDRECGHALKRHSHLL